MDRIDAAGSATPIVWSAPQAPEWFVRAMEFQYRKGVFHGANDATQLVYDLHRGGYSRPAEIGNILVRWLDRLRKWKRSVPSAKTGSCREPNPVCEWKPWATIKAEVHERDGFRCVACGSPDRLEAHHEEPVSDGGLPELENLTTLCFQCHRCERHKPNV